MTPEEIKVAIAEVREAAGRLEQVWATSASVDLSALARIEYNVGALARTVRTAGRWDERKA